jgi:hypothetical protein
MVWTTRKARHRRTYQQSYEEPVTNSSTGVTATEPAASDPATSEPVPAGGYTSSADPTMAGTGTAPVAASRPAPGVAERTGAPVAVRSYHPIRIGGMATLVILLGAWAALVAFIGPSFGYQATSASSWQWTTTNWLLHLVPGAAAVAGGLLIIALWPKTSASSRGLYRLATLVVVAAGGWLVIGPAAWPVIESSSAYGPSDSAWTSFLHQVGANLGPGLLLVLLGGMLLEAAAAKVATTRVATTAISPAPLGRE